MTGRHTLVAAGIVAVYIVSGTAVWWRYYGIWDITQLSAFFQIIYTSATVLMLVGLYMGAIYAKRQLDENRRSSEMQTGRDILERYIENRELFKTRDFIHQHMEAVNRVIGQIVTEASKRRGEAGNQKTELAQFANSRRGTIEEEIKRLSGVTEVTLLDVYLVINAFSNASWMIKQRFVPKALIDDLKRPLLRAHEKLLPLIDYELMRREESRGDELYYGHHFDKLVAEWNREAARKGSSAAGPGPR